MVGTPDGQYFDVVYSPSGCDCRLSQKKNPILITDLAYLDVGAAFTWFQHGRQLCSACMQHNNACIVMGSCRSLVDLNPYVQHVPMVGVH
jgi:hypothetical protein